MGAKTISVLVVGGATAHGTGVKATEGFVEQFARRLTQAGQRVWIDYHTPIDLDTVGQVVPRLLWGHYDLILLELGHNYLRSSQTSAKPLPLVQRLTAQLRLACLKAQHAVGKAKPLTQVSDRLHSLLKFLWPYRHKVILLTPIPQQELVGRWLRRQGRTLVQTLGEQHGVMVFDTHRVIQSQSEYFLDSDERLLNAVSHEIIGSYLFAFYQLMLPSERIDEIRHQPPSDGRPF